MFRLGEQSSSIYAALLVIVLTLINVVGPERRPVDENLLTIVE